MTFWETRVALQKREEGWSVRADTTAMVMMHWAGWQRSKRTERYRPGMGMMPLETVLEKKRKEKKPPISTMP